MRLESEPWPHLECDEFLPHRMALEIARNWPQDGFQYLRHSDITRADGTSLRRYQPLERCFPAAARFLREYSFPLNIETADLFAFAFLVEDSPGYRIRSHTDCAGKVISCQIYLAHDDEHPELGVVLHSRDRSVKRQIPYRFNYGYAFKVSANSWHRVERAEYSRRSIQFIYYSMANPHI